MKDSGVSCFTDTEEMKNAGFLQPIRLCTVFMVNAQTCLNGYPKSSFGIDQGKKPYNEKKP